MPKFIRHSQHYRCQATSALGQRPMMPRPAQIAASVALALAGCSNLGTLVQLDEKASLAAVPPGQAAPPTQAPLIGPNAAIALPKPREMGRSLEVAQLVTLRFAGQSLTFDARQHITPDRLVMGGIAGKGSGGWP